jgi:multiple sugar transport system substrate-binding protein
MGLVVPAFVSLLVACSGGSAVPTLNWYVNPDNGGQAKLAAKCAAASSGRYRIEVSGLPTDATQQREQLVRRLAAKDASIDLMSLDLPFVPEFAEAGFLRPFTAAEAEQFTAGVLNGPLQSATWNGKLVAAPFWANTQLFWYRKSVARKAGLDPAARPVTWDELVKAAEKTGTTVEVQGKRYEGYMVWINALVASAGGKILENPEAGKDVKPGLDSAAGRKAAAIIRELARSRAANPALSTADEEATRSAFQGSRGGFMVNWPYVYGAAQEAVAAHALDEAVLDDIGWARYPRADAARASRPPLGGIDLAVGAFSKHGDLAVEAARCITSAQSQTEYMVVAKNPAARAAAYEDAAVRKIFPMADLIRDSIDASEPRPQTPYYTDVSASVVRTFHPPIAVQPDLTPARAAKLIADVLHDRVLL